MLLEHRCENYRLHAHRNVQPVNYADYALTLATFTRPLTAEEQERVEHLNARRYWVDVMWRDRFLFRVPRGHRHIQPGERVTVVAS